MICAWRRVSKSLRQSELPYLRSCPTHVPDSSRCVAQTNCADWSTSNESFRDRNDFLWEQYETSRVTFGDFLALRRLEVFKGTVISGARVLQSCPSPTDWPRLLPGLIGLLNKDSWDGSVGILQSNTAGLSIFLFIFCLACRRFFLHGQLPFPCHLSDQLKKSWKSWLNVSKHHKAAKNWLCLQIATVFVVSVRRDTILWGIWGEV